MRSIVVAIAVATTWLLPADVPEVPGTESPQPSFGSAAFTFVRVEYDSEGGYGEAFYDFDGRRWMRWETDYPEAEENFLYRIDELTTIRVNFEPISLRLTDPKLRDYPFIYMCDVGWQQLTDEEVTSLRNYLLRGGFLWVDDFWGDPEWDNFAFNMQRVFPDKEWRDIPSGHPILSMVFPLEACPQVPAKIFWMQSGLPFDYPGSHRGLSGVEINQVDHVNFRGLFDEKGRLMAVATHNSDIGDGWEREAEDEAYFEEFSVKSYAIGINIIVYALTH